MIRRHLVRGLFVFFSLNLLAVVTLTAQTPKRRAKEVTGGPVGTTKLVICKGTSASQLEPTNNGQTVYDKAQKVTWLANGNLAATAKYDVPGIGASGSMGYAAAVAWVGKLNAAKYLGHNTWTIPATPKHDSTCRSNGPNDNGFGFGCKGSALGSLYYTGLGLCEPNTAVPMPPSLVKGFKNFQPYLYWADSLSEHKGTDKNLNTRGYVSFSFNAGYKGSNVLPNFLYVIPMINGSPTGAQIPAGATVYDPDARITWLADANLAASQQFGVDSINTDGAMDHATAVKWVKAMNAYDQGKGWLGQKNWSLPSSIYPDPTCSQPNFAFNCTGSSLGRLYYRVLGKHSGEPVVIAPDAKEGPFHNIQPYLYWSCLGVPDKMVCGSEPPAKNFQFSFSFGNGFQGTDYLENDLYVMVYYPDESANAPPPKPAPKRTEKAKPNKPGR